MDEDIQKRILELEEATKNNGGLNFQIAIIMERDEITRAVRTLAEDVKEGKLMPEEVNEACIERYLDTHDIPDPDLLIRTSGEQRLSKLSFVAACLYRVLFYRCSMADFPSRNWRRQLNSIIAGTDAMAGVKEE